MTAYRKLGFKLIAVCVLALSVMLPLPTQAFTCDLQCEIQCDNDFNDCLNNCQGCIGQWDMCYAAQQSCWTGCGC